MRRRRAVLVFIGGTIALALLAGAMPSMVEQSLPKQTTSEAISDSSDQAPQEQEVRAGGALEALQNLEIKGRAPKTGYDRAQFGNGWAKVNGCSTRDIILYRDLENPVLEDDCSVASGTLNDVYSGEVIQFSRQNSAEIQIDHVVALSDAWQKGAQQLTIEERKRLANDPLELVAVSGKENQAKSDGDAATWLPSNKSVRCWYVARQIAVKQKYRLWVTQAEFDAMKNILAACPDQKLGYDARLVLS